MSAFWSQPSVIPYIEIPGANHYTILTLMADVDCRIHRAMVALLRP